MDVPHFSYTMSCSAPGCPDPVRYKLAAVWTDGTSRELKTYGLACEAHRESLREAAEGRRRGLILADGEQIEPVGVYRLTPGTRDVSLERLS